MPIATTAPSTTTPNERDLWRTPPHLFLDWSHRFGPFALDAAADEDNWLCPYWLGPGGQAEDALAVPNWADHAAAYRQRTAWLNPPYSRALLPRFVQKACEQAHQSYMSTVLLIPAATDTRWWHDCLWRPDGAGPREGVSVYFLRGRVRFRRPDGTVGEAAPFASAIVHLDMDAYSNDAVAQVVDSWRTATR